MKHTTLIALSLIAALGCASDRDTGALIGAGGGLAIGGGIGALAAGQKGAIIGAALGGVAGGVSGALIGRYMDKQKEKLDRDLKSGYVEKVGNKLVVKFNSGILFDVDKAELKSEAKTELTDFARVLKDYPDTNLSIQGYTDSTGSAQHNRTLSDERAKAVTDFLSNAQVESRRLAAHGYGEDHPAASNATKDGREKNRRVEIHIEANEQLKQADAENASKRS